MSDNTLPLTVEEINALLAKHEGYHPSERPWATIGELRILCDMALSTARREEAGWLLELASSAPAEPQYWAGSDRDPSRSSAWTFNHAQAIRFARKVDAERVAQRALGDVAVRICEHAWDGDCP